MSPISRPMPRTPAHLSPYVEVLGVDLAVTFFLRFGGSEIHLPTYAEHEPRRGEAVNLIGSENLRQLGDKIGAVKTRVPLANEWITRILAWQGHSAAAIARRIRVTDTTVRRWLTGRDCTQPATVCDTLLDPGSMPHSTNNKRLHEGAPLL